jgi:RNA polymerase sigma-70 factor, ECF subfamily
VGFNTPAVAAAETTNARQTRFERMVVGQAERLYRLALAIGDDPGEAEEAVQETMLIAWRRWSSVEGFANPSAWLTRVCVNYAIRRRRRLARRVLWPGERWAAAAQPELPELYGRLLDLQRAYRTLSPRQRAMVALHVADGYTVEECARILGCRMGTAQSHLGRARAKLRKELTDA